MLIEVFVREIFETRRKDVIRLVITEGPRFPKLAEFYYREVIAHVMAAIRGMLRRAVERGELANDALVRFPQLLAAPGMVAIIWNGLFDRFEPLDVRAHDARAFRHPVRRREARHERAPASRLLARWRSRSPPAASRPTAASRAGSRPT